MANSKKKTVLIVVLLIVLGGALVGYQQWNKPHLKAENQPSIPVSSETLYTAYSGNEKQADSTYLNHVLAVDGTVGEISKNQDGKTVALLTVSDPIGGIQCTFRDAVSLQQGQTVNVKGFCTGYTMVVLLNDCVISK